jgi:hypothetical protein
MFKIDGLLILNLELGTPPQAAGTSEPLNPEPLNLCTSVHRNSELRTQNPEPRTQNLR